MKRERPISAVLSSPTAVALDAHENVYVTESVNNRLLVFGPGGEFLRKLDGLAKPAGLLVDDRGRLHVCNIGRRNVEVYDGGFHRLHALGSGDGEFGLPLGIASGSGGRLYVTDAKANMVKVYRPDGGFSFAFGGSGNDDGRFNFPASIASHPVSGDIVVSDLQVTPAGIKGARIQLFDGSGRFKRTIGSWGRGEGLLMKPLGTAVDAEGRFYVSDAYQNIVHRYDADGIYQSTVYDLGHPMRTPLGIAVSRKTGKLYVASLNTSTVEIYGDGTSGSAGEDPGKVSLSFSASAGGCSVAGIPARRSDSPLGFLASLILPILCVYGTLQFRRSRIRAPDR